MKLTRFKLAFLSYALFDLLIGGHCGGMLPLSSVAAAQMSPVQGNITAASASCLSTNCVTAQLDGSTGAATIQLSGTFSLTAQFEVSNDNGSTFASLNCTPANSTTAASSATATGLWQCNVAGFTHIRVRGSAYTSGTAVVYINSARASAKSGGGAVYASGLGTVNVIPKGNGAGQLADSSCTDNATTVTCTEVIVGPTSSTVAQLSDTASNGSGWAINGANIWGLSSASRRYGLSASQFLLGLTNTIGWSSNTDPGIAGADLTVRRRNTANFALGAADVNGTPVDQTVSVQNAITGSDLPGGHLTIDAPLGTGLGAAAKISINRGIMKATGATAQTSQNAFAVGQSKTLSNTSATAQTVATITLGSNAGGGAGGTFTIVCTDGTNFDSETQAFTVSFVNKATVVTVGTPAITTSTAANNSGSCTLGITAVASTNDIAIKVTPVFTTIVPTTVTLYPIITHSTNTVTFN